MDSSLLAKVNDLISQNDEIGIAVGKDPGIDQMGAALALYLSLLNSEKKVSIACPTQPIVEISSLVGIDKVKKSFDSEDGDLTVSFPYKEGEIEKISYTLENGFLNIMVKAGAKGLGFDQQDVLFKRIGGAPKLIFTVGTPRLSDMTGVFDIEDVKDTTIVNIDNHLENQGFGDVVFVSKNLSSVSEQVAGFIQDLGLKFDQDSAQNLMSGIIEGTQNFQSPKTSPLAFEMAGLLLKNGAKRETQKVVSKDDQVVKDDLYSFFNQPKHNKATSAKSSGPPQQNVKIRQDDSNNPPEDWLAPKIYKGSTSI